MTSQRSTATSRSGRQSLRSNRSSSSDSLKRKRNPEQFPDEDAVDRMLVGRYLRERGIKPTVRAVFEARAELRRKGLIDQI
jgi:hypothetical protein